MLGLSLLSATVKRDGFKSHVLDLNADLGSRYQQLFPDHSWAELESIFDEPELFARHQPQFDLLVEEWSARILSLAPKYVGFSAFTQRNRFMIKMLCGRLRQKDRNVKILIGGADCASTLEFLQSEQLIDFYILGEADEAIVHLLRGDLSFPGINSLARPIKSLSDIPIPDYSDLDFSQYTSTPRAFYVTASRGCPFQCTFCDVRSIWQNYRLRAPERTLQEIEFCIRTYHGRKFLFTDSLLNGNMDHYRALLTGLSKLRQALAPDLTWEGFCVITPVGKMSDDDFLLLKSSGCSRVKIGVESGSPAVRRHMHKPYNSDDLDDFLHKSAQAQVGVDFMLMVGYPTETLADFQMTKDLLKRYQPYAAGGTIQFIRIDMTSLSKTQPLYRMRKRLNIHVTKPGADWDCPTLQFSERLRRYFDLRSYAFDLGYKMMATQDRERQSVYRRKR